MALDESQVYLPARGYIFIGDEGTSAPDDIDSFDVTEGTEDWENIGHTARDELPEFGFDGGDTENLGTWQNATLRVVETETTTHYVTFNVHQFNNLTLGLYYGSDGGSTPDRFEVQEGTGGSDRALLIVIVDGQNRVAFHAPAVTIRSEDSISLESDAFAYLPLRATLRTTGEYTMAWIAPGLNEDVSS